MKTKNPKNDPEIDNAIRQVLTGDPDAFELVVERLERPLRGWLAVQTPPGIDVDEVAQRSFVIAYTRLDQYTLGTNFSAWLFTIARFQLRTELTYHRRITDYHARFAPELLQRELERRGEEISEQQQDRLDGLERCVSQLGEHLRKFIAWRYEEQISLKEMSTRCGRSVPAIKKQLWKIRGTLRVCLETRLSDEGTVS